MTRKQYEEAKRLLEETTAALQSDGLSGEQRAILEVQKAKLAGILLRPWLPTNRGNQMVMAVLLLLGLLWPLGGNPAWAICWILMFLCSPRVVGEAAFFCGRLASGFGSPSAK